MEEKRPEILQKIRTRTILFHMMLLTPVLLFWATIVASLERTPLTGRCVFCCVRYAHRVYLHDPAFLVGGDSSCYRRKKRIK